MTTQRAALLGLAALTASAAVTLSVHAVQPQRFTHTNEADFEPGEFEGTVVTDLGDLELATKSALVAKLPEKYTVVYDIVEVNGETYIAAGPEGVVFKIVEKAEDDNADKDAEQLEDEESGDDVSTDDEAKAETASMSVEVVIELPGEQVFDLAVVDGKLVAAVSGAETSRVMPLDMKEGESATIALLPETRYIWSILPLPQEGKMLLATGIEGQVLRYDLGSGETEVILDTPQANVLTLAGTPDGNGGFTFPVYAGTDTDGIVYRLNEDGSSSAIYDAAEPEVAALVVAADGTLYAGTADAEQARPGRMDGANEEDTGRPDTDTPAGEILDAPDAPEVPGDPGDAPDEPLPIDPDPTPMQTEVQGMAQDTEQQADDAQAQADAVEAEDAPAEPSDVTAEADAGDDALAQGETTDISPEQYDALREEVRKRLETARKTGKLAAGGTKAASTPKATRPRAAGSPEASAKEGNAVYKITPDGLVTEPFRESVMILGLSLDEAADRLLIATGSEGQLYEVKLGEHETAVLDDLDAEQVVTLHANGPKTILGTANPATLRTLAAAADDDTTGTYTSPALDAEQISLWGKLQLAAQRGGLDGVTVETRSGAVADPDAAAWSPWEPATAAGNKTNPGMQLFAVASPPARFIQYRLTLAGSDQDAPAIGSVELAYVRPNLAPRITTFTAVYADAPEDPDEPTPTIVNLEWEAADPNGDRVRFDVQAQPMPTDNQPSPGWLTVAEDLEDTSYEWDTRTIPDGRYILRVVAQDRLDNPKGSAKAGSRRSDPLLLDNTPPTFVLDPDQDGDTPGRMIGKATDAASPIAAVEYRTAADAPWRPALPDDLIYDSTTEAFSFTLPRLASGGHVLSIRARDTRGNTHYASRFITVP